MNIKVLASTFILTTAFLASAGIALADGSVSQCQVIYGGGTVCNNQVKFSINKMVEIPNTTNFVKNLTVNDQKYTAGATVPFKIVITNTGNTQIGHIAVTDSLPQYLTFVSGDGTWDPNARTITFNVNNLNVGGTQQFMINAKVVSDNQLPQDQGTVCVVNQVNATEDSGATASDSSQVCITRQALVAPTPEVFTTVPVKTVPNTGPEMLPLLGLIPTAFVGIGLRKKSKIK